MSDTGQMGRGGEGCGAHMSGSEYGGRQENPEKMRLFQCFSRTMHDVYAMMQAGCHCSLHTTHLCIADGRPFAPAASAMFVAFISLSPNQTPECTRKASFSLA